MPTLQIPEKLERFLTTPKRFKIAFGGRGAAKSQTFADMLLFEAQVKGYKVGCFRELQNSIDDSVHALLKDEIERLELDGFNVWDAKIQSSSGGEFRFKGLSRNPDAVKSMHGFKRFWVEEAQSISQESLKKLTPTLREDDSEIWFSMNPQSSADPMSKRFLNPYMDKLLKDGYYEDDLHLIVWINYQDNPWFPQTLEQERQWDFENTDRAEYDHTWLGHFNDTVDGSIIKAEWFDAAIDAHIELGFKPRGQSVVTHDPSDSGDAKALAYSHGVVFLDVQENTKHDVNDGCDWALDYAINKKADVFRWDCDGLGISLKRQVADSLNGKKIALDLFKGSESPENPTEEYQPIDGDSGKNRQNQHVFKNKRAQCYWLLRDRFYLTYRAVTKGEYIDPDQLISLSSNIENIEKLRSEVCRIPKKANGSGLIQIMSKEEMKTKHKIDSPNMADCLMMRMAALEEIDKEFFKPIPIRARGLV